MGDAAAYLKGERHLQALFTPTATRSLAGFGTTKSKVILNILDNVAGRVEEVTPLGGGWQHRAVEAPFPGSLSTSASLHDPHVADDPLAEAYFLSYTDYLTPDSLYLARTGSDKRELLKSRPHFFDSTGMNVEQRFATSKDGTKVPYFIIWPKGAKADGQNPTLLYGYGGFEISLTPSYSGGIGKAWYEHGGVWVYANIRGGGEYGPAWHQAAVKENKQRSYDDFEAVAEDLIATKVTSPRHLGIEGGSNGGLLVGAVAMQRPDLFNAVSCQVPLLDMKRYNKLLAGASWMAEYGNPDIPAEWAWISKYSPYQNVHKDSEVPDDPLHHVHARRPRAPGPRAQDGGAHDRAGPRCPLLREHRGRPRRRGGQRATCGRPGAAVRVPVAEAGQVNAPGWRAACREPTRHPPGETDDRRRHPQRIPPALRGHRRRPRLRGRLPAARREVMWMTHTGVPSAVGGRGVAAELVRVALAWAEAQGYTVEPACSYVEVYMRRHPETQTLLAR